MSKFPIAAFAFLCVCVYGFALPMLGRMALQYVEIGRGIHPGAAYTLGMLCVCVSFMAWIAVTTPDAEE